MAQHTTTTTESPSARRYRRVLSASTLAGDRVVNAKRQDIGRIDEIMIDVPTGRIAYAVLSFGGFLGMGDKFFAIPWSRLTLDKENKVFLLDLDRETLQQAPGFDKNNWPDMADPAWGSAIYSYYGSEPYWDNDLL